MNRSVKFRYKLLFYTCKAVGALPDWFLYHVLLDVLFFIIYYVVRYRRKVVDDNLCRSFPERSEQERRRIARKYYLHLAEIMVDTIDLAGITRQEMARRMRFPNFEAHQRQVAGQDWIAALAHYGSWEYFGAYNLYTEPDEQIIGVYRPLHDKVFDLFYYRMRTRFGLVPVSMNLLLRYIIRTRQKGQKRMILGIIADQTPPFFEIDHWYDFLHQPTAFFSGTETLALRFGMPVYFMYIRKVSRAHYEADFEMIYDGKEEVATHEITRRYVERLEAMIRETPELWMWSHRRWKHTPSSLRPGQVELNQERRREKEDRQRRKRERQEKDKQTKGTDATVSTLQQPCQ